MHKHPEDIAVTKNVQGIDSLVLINHEHALSKQLILRAFESVPEHKVPVDVTFFVLEGQGGKSVQAQNDTFFLLNIKTPSFKVDS